MSKGGESRASPSRVLDTVVVIPNWNGGAMLLECLNALERQTFKVFEVIVVDNASDDCSAAQAEKHSTRPIVIQLDRNRGFTGAVNIGLRYAIDVRALYVAVLNNDARPNPEWLGSLRNRLIEDDKAAVVAPCVVRADETGGSAVVDDAGIVLDSRGRPCPRWRGRDIGDLDLQSGGEIIAASGAACLYRVAALETTGLFPCLFAYYEDVDLSLRLRRHGWTVLFEPSVFVYHLVSATSSRVPWLRDYYGTRNMFIVAIRTYPRTWLMKAGLNLTTDTLRDLGRLTLQRPALGIRLLVDLLWRAPVAVLQRWKICAPGMGTLSDMCG